MQDEDVECALLAEAREVRPGLLPHQHSDDDINARFRTMPLLEGSDGHDLSDYDGGHSNRDVEHAGDVIAEAHGVPPQWARGIHGGEL